MQMDATRKLPIGLTVSLEQEAAILSLEAGLGYVFTDRSRLLTALCHRSYVHQFREGGAVVEDNQRLEFLGDAVLSLCISTALFTRFPEGKEGNLSKMRAGLINESALAHIGRSIGLDRALLLGRGEEATGGRKKNSILADALEAVMAAIFLDGGQKAAMQVVTRLWGDLVACSSVKDLLKDYKTRLQEETQQHLALTPKYQLTDTVGPAHARNFEVSVTLGTIVVARGRGRSKKEAEQAAARAALEAIRSGEWTVAAPASLDQDLIEPPNCS